MGEIAGPALNKPAFVLLVILNVSVCLASSVGPALIPVAHGLTVCGPLSSNTVWSGPLVKLGASLTRIHRDGERLRCTGVYPAIGRPAVVRERNGNRRRPVGIRRRRVGQDSGCADRRPGTEERGLVLPVTLNVSVCVLPSPSLIAVAHPLTVCAPASSFTV